MIDTIRGAFYLFPIGIITFYSGVLVWKERDAKINEIQDASPTRTGMLFTSKVIAMLISIFVVLCSTILLGIDPYNYMIDRIPGDNVKRVMEKYIVFGNKRKFLLRLSFC